MTETYATDWLATRTFFYNTRTGTVATHIHEVIDYRNLEFDPDGLNDYLDLGYSVFGQTPVRDVKFLLPCSELVRDARGRWEVRRTDDPITEWIGRDTTEEEVLEWLGTSVRSWEATGPGEVILPLSGGLDTRLLALMLSEPSRVQAFTYGISDDQGASFETVRARFVARRLGMSWERIELGRFHEYLDHWDDVYGVATHAHGMYLMEFFDQIRSRLGPGRRLLSGIVGDAWAGSIAPIPVSGPDDLWRLGYTHGLRGASSQSRLRGKGQVRERFWHEHRDALIATAPLQTVWVIRLKMIVLSCLLRLPKHYGFTPWSPFLIPKIALGMLTLPRERRRKRIWQKEFFRRQGLDLEREHLKCDVSNTLNAQGLRRVPPPPLDASLLAEVVRPEYVNWINRTMFRRGATRDRLMRIGYHAFCSAASLLRQRPLWLPPPQEWQAAYAAYLTLRPIERLLERRNAS
ncbi:MAG TPA: hypothetical protein VGK93_09745 [Candidatus Eisenbacteria bacterium]|jgi:hypothetical protein